jgi:hypothetical protein
MADLPEGLLDTVKAYLHITWQDDATDSTITGYINRGMKRLQTIAGASLDFTVEDQPRMLLLDYCRYANSQALEVFEQNFQSELLDLNLRTQAPVIDGLNLMATQSSEGTTFSVVPMPHGNHSYVYQVGTGLTLPARLEPCLPGSTWIAWDGLSPIPVSSGQQIMIVEINDEYAAERSGMVTV